VELARLLIPAGDQEQERVLDRLKQFALELLQWNRGVST
jgi:hypothetical protein